MGNFNNFAVLISPLDWGLGHTTRCIPIIKTFIKLNYNVVIAANAKQKKVLQQEFSDIQIEELSGYNISYSNNRLFFYLKIVWQTPKILLSIYKENRWLRAYLKTNKVDIIISDNRYGFYSKKVKSIFITHQLKIKANNTFIENILQKINYHYINKFECCWIPDYEGSHNIAGELSHPEKLPQIPVHYIGLLSRLAIDNPNKNYDLCILLSGPEPSRTYLEKRILSQLNYLSDKKILFVRGLPNEETQIENDNCTIHNHLTGLELQKAICSSNIVLCRSGYTSLMELIALRKKIIAIPTPMQTEQEYLAEYLSQKQMLITANQNNFSLSQLIKQAETFVPAYPEELNNGEYKKISKII